MPLVSKLFDQWVLQLKDEAVEVGATMSISDRLLAQTRAKMGEMAMDRMIYTLALHMLTHGQAPVSVTLEEMRNHRLAGWDYALLCDTEKRPLVAGYLMVIDNWVIRAQQELRLPWWKLAWRRFRGKLTSKLPWEVK